MNSDRSPRPDLQTIMTANLLARLEEADAAAVKTAIDTNGAATEDSAIFMALAKDTRLKYNEIKDDLNLSTNPNDWLATLTAVAAAIV